MKNIYLKFYGLGIKDEMQAYVKILNQNKEIVFEGYTYNSELSLCLNTNCLYKLIAISCNEQINLNFYLDSKLNCYSFYFPRSIVSNIVTFQLTDYFYKDLKIGKGEIILWQK